MKSRSYIRPRTRKFADEILGRAVTDAEWADLKKPNGDRDALRISRPTPRYKAGLCAPWLLVDYFSTESFTPAQAPKVRPIPRRRTFSRKPPREYKVAWVDPSGDWVDCCFYSRYTDAKEVFDTDALDPQYALVIEDTETNEVLCFRGNPELRACICG